MNTTEPAVQTQSSSHHPLVSKYRDSEIIGAEITALCSNPSTRHLLEKIGRLAGKK